MRCKVNSSSHIQIRLIGYIRCTGITTILILSTFTPTPIHHITAPTHPYAHIHTPTLSPLAEFGGRCRKAMLGACCWLRVSTAFPVRSEFSCFVAAFFRSVSFFLFIFFCLYISLFIFCFVWFLYVVVLKYERKSDRNSRK